MGMGRFTGEGFACGLFTASGGWSTALGVHAAWQRDGQSTFAFLFCAVACFLIAFMIKVMEDF